MCFSAPASFIAASGLSVVGVISTQQARTRKIIPFALIPFFFALQQACEGFVWLTVNNNNIYNQISIYAYLFFASIWWPFWIPFSLCITEENNKRKTILLILLIMGLILASCYLLSWLLFPQTALVINHHMAYPLLSTPFMSASLEIIYLEKSMAILYLLATVLPLFVSSVKNLWLAGIIIIILCIIARLYFAAVFGSLWCFFAAIASLLICLIVRTYKK